jgi:creatinine amidohydrolase
VILVGGVLEQHGPYLPSYADGYINERLGQTLAEAVVARPGWNALIFPPVPLGNSGANDVGGKRAFPATWAVRAETLRAIFMDLADELGAQGFRWIFVAHIHGAPNHNRALDQAGDYFHDTWGGRMVNLTGLLPVIGSTAPKTPERVEEDGLPIHAGMDETSLMLFFRPGLVRPGFLQAVPRAGGTMEGVVEQARKPDCPGYVGSPRLATAAHGAARWQAMSSAALEAETARARRQRDWLARIEEAGTEAE